MCGDIYQHPFSSSIYIYFLLKSFWLLPCSSTLDGQALGCCPFVNQCVNINSRNKRGTGFRFFSFCSLTLYMAYSLLFLFIIWYLLPPSFSSILFSFSFLVFSLSISNSLPLSSLPFPSYFLSTFFISLPFSLSTFLILPPSPPPPLPLKGKRGGVSRPKNGREGGRGGGGQGEEGRGGNGLGEEEGGGGRRGGRARGHNKQAIWIPGMANSQSASRA